MENPLQYLEREIASQYWLNDTEETFIQYKKDENTEKMFKFVVDHNASLADLFLNSPISNECKDEVTSNKLREEGNKCYKSQKLREALEAYNKCILLAPHPKLHLEKIETDEYTSLAKGFGNRSALLFRVKEYAMCICDIDRSLNLCNSKITELTLKLNERKVNCLIFIQRYKEAKALCRIMLETLDLQEKVNESKKQAFAKLSLQSDEVKQNQREKSQHKNRISKYEEVKSAISEAFSSDDLIFAYNNPPPPSLDDESNPTIPAFSCALKLQHSPEQGRFVVATRDIKPGEVLTVETAYTSCVDLGDPKSSFSFCSSCFARCAAPIPCHECTHVVFCNEECRSRGWTKFHMIECPVYPHLQLLGTSFIQTYRIIAGRYFDELKVNVTKLKNEEQRSPLERMLNEDNICDSNSYRSVYFLEGTIKTMRTQLLFMHSVIASIMTRLLIRSNRFFRNDGGKKLLPDIDVILIGSLFIRHICGIGCNSFTLLESHVSANAKNSVPGLKLVGYGTYIAVGLFNHSCMPSVSLFFYGNVGVIRSICFIPSGNPVNINYSHLYYREPDRNVRRKHLSFQYSFICNCEACVGDFGMKYYDLREIEHKFPVPKLRNKSRRVSRNDLDSTICLQSELDDLLKKNANILLEYYSPCSDVTKYLELAQETIEFFDRFVEMPDQLYIQLSVIFRDIFDLRGSCYFDEETN